MRVTDSLSYKKEQSEKSQMVIIMHTQPLFK